MEEAGIGIVVGRAGLRSLLVCRLMTGVSDRFQGFGSQRRG